MNFFITLLLLFCYYSVDFGTAEDEKYVRTIHGYKDPSQIFVVNSDQGHRQSERHKRSVLTSVRDNGGAAITSKINYLNDTHKQLVVYWVGKNSNVIICLAREPYNAEIPLRPSATYISYNNGDSYINKTEDFKLPDGSYATLELFYIHPKNNTHFVFADVRHNMLFVTNNHGRNIQRIELSFTPSNVSFHELQPAVFVVLDEADPLRKLWITEDFGTTFRQAQTFVKAFYWLKSNLVVQRIEPSGNSSTVLYSEDLFKNGSVMVHATDIKDLFVKGDYLFTTKMSSQRVLELYVSNKLGREIKCDFDTQLQRKNYFIVDITNTRALVAVSHTSTAAHLYVSESLNTEDNVVKFTLSLEDVFCHFPNSTWHDTWIHIVSKEAFAEVYKIEGITGAYIASRVLLKPTSNNLGPQHLGSVITFDHGRTWRLIKAPAKDAQGQLISCSSHKNCSLHLTQKFSQLYPSTEPISILSSKSAPGFILATGVVGKSLKGHYGVYISNDAGLTWKQTLRDPYFFNMGDHGGILTAAIKHVRPGDRTRHLLYSTDEGENWKQTAFHDQDLRLYALITEPGENSTIFTMFGLLPQEHQWVVVKVDLSNAFAYKCTKNDYKSWSPSQFEENGSYIPCVLGQQLTYQRRMPNANCYNGLDFDTPVSLMPCECDGYDYECDFGFVRVNNTNHCIRNSSIIDDPYTIPLSCEPSKFYNRTKGYRKIQGDVCTAGLQKHYLPEEVPCPVSEAEDFLLLAQRTSIRRFNLVTKTVEELPLKNLNNVIAFDFDMKNDCIYWADIDLDIIGRQCLNDSAPEILVTTDLVSVEGMALDWISNTLYFVDEARSKIELIRTDINHSGRMRRTVLGADKLHKPRGIALHPRAGYMFWTDWSTENPSVNRADLDGSNILKLFGKPKVVWPNGITVDYIAERIYWVDARLDYIASSDLRGHYLKIFESQEGQIQHPFAITVFKNTMYWDDWKRKAIFSADKDTFQDFKILQEQLFAAMDIKVFAHGLQIGTNVCSNNICPYICVGLPKDKHECLCPDGMTLNQDKCLCPGNVPPLANYTCPPYENTCGPEHFKCTNSFCVPKEFTCNGKDDCGDGSDEKKCGAETCPPNYFVCGDGKCLPQYWRCDFDTDCADGSDEVNCPRQNCTAGQFKCSNDRCIQATWQCDGENDCRDGLDEANCAEAEPPTCKDSDFKCSSGGVTCIPATWLCDGETDCEDGTDEGPNCKNVTCQEGQFSCGLNSNKCIYLSLVCDGDSDCPDGRDERNCTMATPDPSDISDQIIPKNGTCPAWMFKCFNQRCIPDWWKCDKANDCDDGSDEVGCPTSAEYPTTTTTTTATPKTCASNFYQCGNGACIYSAGVCNGMIDCDGGEDEAHCSSIILCNKGQFYCKIDGSCIPFSAVCNQQYDCPDRTDEIACDHVIPNEPASQSSSLGYFPCDGNHCVPLAALCDVKQDCIDGNCTKVGMGVDKRSVNRTSLLLYWWIATPLHDKLEFMPSISKVGENKWQNQSWTNNTEYKFTNLEPFTKYNMTLYVRWKNNTKITCPLAKYHVFSTGDDIPSKPLNLIATQKNESYVLLTWDKPIRPNGQIINYEISWYPPDPPISLNISGDKTAHLLSESFKSNVTYTFRIAAFNQRFPSILSEEATLTFDDEMEE